MKILTSKINFAYFENLLRPLLFIIGLLFLAALVVHSLDNLLQLLPTIRWPFFVLSVLIGFLVNLSTSFFFKELLNKYSIEATYQLAHKVFFYAQIAKYIPGKVWVLFYQAMLVQKIGSTSSLVFANLDLTAISILISATIATSLIALTHNIVLSGVIFFTGLLLCVLIGKFCYLLASVNYFFTYIKPLKNKFPACHTEIKVLKIVTYYTVFWITYLASGFLMMFAVFNFSISQSAVYLAYLGLAWIVGVLSFFVPGGMGVRELIFILLAQQSFPQAISLDLLAIIAITARFWNILQELTGISLILSWNFYKSENK